jgi:Zn-dependent protease with chaperone function
VLFIGFYVLAALVIVILVSLPLLEYAAVHRVTLQLVAFSLGSAWAIAWGVAPRFDHFPAPGPRLLPDAQPRLFELLNRLARETGQPMPDDVYLVLDVNAFVAQRGGVMGFGSRPVMGLGLPLLQVLSVSELEAVIAHELGHYAGSDTKLAPWVYKTRLAIGRTVASVRNSAVRKPFEWYGKLFLWLTHAVSRSQELSADALAAKIAGARALVSSLRHLEGAAPTYRFFWESHFGPLLQAGYRPPLAEGFARFIGAPAIAKRMEEIPLEIAESGKPADPHDTHPSLAEREAAVAHLGDTGGPEPSPEPALSLLDGVAQLEAELLRMRVPPALGAKLRPVAWDDVGMTHWMPFWRKVAEHHADQLAGLHVRDLDALFADRARLDRKVPPSDALAAPEQRLREQVSVLYAALIAALTRAGWTLDVSPGYEAELRREAYAFRPGSLLHQLAEKPDATREAWQQLVADTGIGDLALARPPD